MGNRPYFSIIVAAYNAESTIRMTIDSILRQSFSDYEIVVKDALSTDQTLEHIPESKHIRVISTKDHGIYDGMNEGIREAHGKFLCFLNCGDIFHSSEVLAQVHAAIIQGKFEDDSVVYGDCFAHGKVEKNPEVLTRAFLLRRPLCHQTMFFARSLFETYGCYDCTYKIVADYDFTLKTFCSSVPYHHVNVVICAYLGDGFSTRNAQLLAAENQRVLHTYFSKKELCISQIKAILTLRRLRIYIASDRSPAWLRNLYRSLSNTVNR